MFFLQPESTTIKKIPNEYLSVVSRKLFCEYCRDPVSVKKSVLLQHIKSAKHTGGKRKLQD